MNYTQIPAEEIIQKTADTLKEHGINVMIVNTKEEALEEVKKHIPQGSKVMNGSSTTLKDIGFVDYLKAGEHGWVNLHEEVLKEQDYPKQADLRRKSLTEADYFLGSVNAISQEGQLVAVDNTGSRVGAYPYAAKNLLLVASANKIMPNLETAMKRVREYVFNLENERMKEAYGIGTGYGKWVIIEHERIPNRITLILVKEALGF